MIDALAALWPAYWMRPWWLLALAPTLLAFYWQWRNHQQQSQWQRLIEPALLTHLLHNPVNARIERRRAWPLACVALASCIAIVALAGPAWQKLPQTPQQKHNSLVIIADLTLSMHAQDVAPSRLTRMRYKLLELLARRSEGQTALIAYSGDAHLVSPLTDDARTIAALVPALAPEIMPSIGSNAAAAFGLASAILADAPGPVRLVWFTDEVLQRDHDRIREVVDQHRAELVIVGIGTTTGGPVPLPSGRFLKDQQQNIVTAQLSTTALRNLAAQVGGSYIGLRTDNADIDLALRDSLFDKPLAASHSFSLERGAPDTAIEHGGKLVFDAWLDRGATLCLLLLPVALLAFRRGVVLACWCLLPVLTLHTQDLLANPAPSASNESSAAAANSLWLTPDQRAQKLLDEQRYQDAAATFKRKDWRGVAAFRGQQYAQAVTAFSDHLAALENADPPDANNAEAQRRLAAGHYNLGHAQAYNGELQQAIEHYQSALEVDPDFTAAADAKALLEEMLREQEQQQQSEQQAGEQQQSDPQNAEQQSAQQSEQQSGQQQSGQNKSDQQSAQQSGQSSQSQAEQQAQDSQAARSDDYRGNSESDQQRDAQASQQSDERAEHALSESDSEAEAKSESELETDRDASQIAGESDSDKTAQQANTAMASAEADGDAIDPERARLQQWLNKIEDDPGGLLRRKFQYQRQLRERERNVIDNSEDGQLW